MNLNWNQIRSLDGSQNNSFEELVCQLANAEIIEKKKKFIRIAAPDGGIESYVELENGDYYGWQAKFFTNSFTESQWKQIEKSFEDALTNYPNLTKYFICCPTDRNNAYINNKISFLEKWKSKEKKWSEFAKNKGRNITFEYWGSHELFERLSKEINIGKFKFWFSKNEYSLEWFKSKNQIAISNLGDRYSPNINVELPISLNFEALIRSKKFKTHFANKIKKILLKIINETIYLKENPKLASELASFTTTLISELDISQYDLTKKIPIIYINNRINIINKNIDILLGSDDINNNISKILINLNKISSLLKELLFELDSTSTQLFNGKYLFLYGDAGQGKSHLLADFVDNKEKQNCHLLLLGQEFTEESNIWYQILNKNLRVSENENEFLSILNSISELNNERFLIVIDAINEGEGKILWRNSLNGFLKIISKYPRIGLVISIRTSYKDEICRNLTEETSKLICEVEHTGFQESEFEASRVFFDYYQIQAPRIPLLKREFSNPLYLILFCKSLKVQNLNSIPKDFKGFFQIINYYLDGINQVISNKIDEDSSLKLLKIALDVIVKNQLNHKSSSLLYIKTRIEIGKILSEVISDDKAKKFIDYMILEGILIRNITFDSSDEIIYFTYERMGDYINAEYLLRNFNVFPDFLNWLRFNNYTFLEIDNFYLNKGLWQSLSVLVPLKYKIELFENIQIADNILEDFKDIIIESLVWRDPAEINKIKIIDFLKKGSFTYKNYLKFIDTIYQVIAEEDHPFNGFYLHQFLDNYSLSERDSIWTKVITLEIHNCPAVDRLIKWCLSYSNDESITTESMLKISIGLAWLFTTTNPQLRNETTFALANILVNRIDVSIFLIRYFYKINDPYVLERVLLAIYSALLNSTNLDKLCDIANIVHELIFIKPEQLEVFPNILVRSYAKNIIDFHLFKNEIKLLPQVICAIKNSINIPYNSQLPEILPSISDIDLQFQPNENDLTSLKINYSKCTILDSMTTEFGRGIGRYGDFGRYIFQSKLFRWSNKIDVNLLSNYACQLIFNKYGYDPVKHGDFDINLLDELRHSHKIERIGKKYQWLSLFEVLALVSDTHQYHSEYWNNESNLIWLKNINDLYIREIDPTFFINKNASKNNKNKELLNKMPVVNFKSWEADLLSWAIIKQDIPEVIEFQYNEEDWLVLERYLDFTDQKEFSINNDVDVNHLCIQVRSYFTTSSKYTKAINWLKKQRLIGRWMPESNPYECIFSKEYYWSEAYKEQSTRNGWTKLVSHAGNQPPDDVEIMPTTERHSWDSRSEENGYSYLAPCRLLVEKLSINYSDKLGFWQDDNGKTIAFDPSVMDSGNDKNLDLLVIRKKDLLKFLQTNKLKIFWTACGEKQSRSSQHRHNKTQNQILEFSNILEIFRNEIKAQP